jgi:Cu/Ag efflux pump CusA
MRYPTAALFALVLFAAGGLGVYLFERGRSPGDPASPPAERGDRDLLPPDKPVRHNPSVVVEVVAAYDGANAEEVERQVTVPLEVTFAGMRRLQTLRCKSMAGLSWLHVGFEPGTDYDAARQQVINRLQFIQHLPPGVSPQIAPRPGGETLRYVLVGPRDAQDRQIYTLNDLRALQDWHLEREFRRLPGVADVYSGGGTVKRYEIVPDPDRLRRYGITLQQLVDTVARSNANVAADLLVHGQAALNVRAVGLFGGGVDPLSAEVLTAADPRKAGKLLRAAEQQRLREIRALVVAKVNDQPVSVGDLVEGGRTAPGDVDGGQGVVVTGQARVGRVACSGPGKYEDADVVHGVVQLRQGEDPRLLCRVRDRIRVLNATAGKLLPGVRIEPYYPGNDGTGVLWVYGMYPLSTTSERMAANACNVAQLLREFPEVERVVSQVGMSAEDDLQSSNHLQLFIGLKAGRDVPAAEGRDGPRPRAELLEAFNHLLSAKVPGVGWLTTTKGPEELGLVFPGAPAENLLKVFGPDLDELERLAGSVSGILRTVVGIESVAAYHSLGQPHLDFRIDPEKCQKWGVTVADVSLVLQTALRGRSLSAMVEGEKSFDITVRWPKRLRESETAILDLSFDIANNKVDATEPLKNTPRIRLRDLVSPVGKDGKPDPKGEFLRSGAAAIYRENGNRLLPVRFSVSGRPLADVRAEAAKKIAPLLKAPYRIEWSD